MLVDGLVIAHHDRQPAEHILSDDRPVHGSLMEIWPIIV
jgi:hypothetical protein